MVSASGGDDLSSIPGFQFALCGSQRLFPDVFAELHHGASAELDQAFLLARGLPARGQDVDLAKHVEQPVGYDPQTSAFRGTVQLPVFPGFSGGAVDWAGDGGLVFEIRYWPGYDISRLEGRLVTAAGHRGALLQEQEIAIPARVPKRYVTRIGDVKDNGRGQLKVVWRL